MKLLRLKSGFTLIELVITAVVLGIIAAMAVPDFFRAMQKIKLNAATRDITSDLRWARSKAISSRTPVGLFFDFNNKSYCLFFDTDDPANFQYDPAKDSTLQTKNLGDLANASSTFNNDCIVFKPDGTCYASGTITCVSTDSTWSKVVDILASTGRIKITS